MSEPAHLAASRRAAERHAARIAAGPPRHARLVPPAAVAVAVAAVAALAVSWPAAALLAALAAVLAGVAVEDRRNAWRWAPDPVTPARVLAPRAPAATEVEERVIDLRDPVAPTVAARHTPTAAVASGSVPRPRVAPEHKGGALRPPVVRKG
jgi:hypothetical protein